MEYLRKCRDCGLEAVTEEDLELFRKRKTHKHNRENLCKKCDSKRSLVYFNDNPHIKKKRRDTYLQKTYDISLREFEDKKEEQDNRCSICGNKEGSTRLTKFVVGHCHTTGTVRDILCGRCNVVLGLVEEDQNLLDNLKEYLQGNNDE